MSTHAWHALTIDDALARVESRLGGLTSAEARRRLATHGPNALIVVPPRSAWLILRDQLRSLIVALLAAAAVLSYLLLDDALDAVAILAVLVLNVGIGFFTELKARRSMEALRSMDAGQAHVVRDEGELSWIDARELVPGDVVDLEPGLAVPADLRLIEVAELSANEAPLTGESMPVRKGVEATEKHTLLGGRSSMLHKGTLVTAGTGRGLVVATGMQTEVGRISELVQQTEDESSPLERRLARLGSRLAVLALGVAGLVSLLGWLRGGEAWLMIETGIALAVAAVPEGLPVVATITLAVGMQRMARRRALVRRLPAVEALGSVTVVCTDKTGTLTAGEMTLTVIALADQEIRVTGAGYGPDGELREAGEPVAPREGSVLHDTLAVCTLANGARVECDDGCWLAQGDPTEAALLVGARKGGLERDQLLERLPELGELPFSSERMLMATFHRQPDGSMLACVKGAPERVVERCTSRATAEGPQALDDAGRAAALAENAALAGRGLRVLAIAKRVLAERPGNGDQAWTDDDLHELQLLAMVGLMDPPAEGVADAIASLRGAGVRTIMITGDQPQTAEAVARELGVLGAGETVVDGTRLGTLDDEELEALLEHAGVFSRTAPAEKLRIVRGLQSRGEVVGMLGDGVNDAAALKGADVGVAMGGRGTDVAKETADVVLADDRLQSVAVAVEGGRVIDDNIRKFIFYLFSCNLAEVLVLLSASLLGLPLPLLPLQILWLNLVTDVFPALALAMEPPEPDVMRRPPADPSAAILSRHFTLAVVVYSLIMTLPVMVVFLWALGDESALDSGQRAGTLAFLALAFGQIFHAFNARGRGSVLRRGALWENGWMWAAVALCTVLALAAVYVAPLNDVMRLVPVSAGDALVVLGAALVPLVAGQLLKARRGREAAVPDSSTGARAR